MPETPIIYAMTAHLRNLVGRLPLVHIAWPIKVERSESPSEMIELIDGAFIEAHSGLRKCVTEHGFRLEEGKVSCSSFCRHRDGFIAHLLWDESATTATEEAMRLSELSTLRQAFGLVSTLAPEVLCEVADPIAWAKEVERSVLAQLKVKYKQGWIHAMQSVKGIDGFIVDTTIDQPVLYRLVQSLQTQIINHMRADVRCSG